MKRKIIICVSVLVILLVAASEFGLYLISRSQRAVVQLRAAYGHTQGGMTTDEVRAIMAPALDNARGSLVPMVEHEFELAYEESDSTELPAWDDVKLPPAEARRIVSAISYSIPAISASCIFEFTFDRERRLVGRHIYD